MFAPYHRFANCQSLRRLINNLQNNNNITPSLLDDHRRYHYAVYHKLKSTQHYTEKLDSILSNPTLALAAGTFLSNVNRNLDGFFHCGGGALDILAREVLIYFGIPLPQNVYFNTARDILFQRIPPEPIINHLQEPSWKNDFSNYRNVCTHELLIVAHYSVDIDEYGETQIQEISLPLPDNPRSALSEHTYRNHPDVLVYCKTTLKRLLTLINVVYGDLVDKITTINRLPL